jgi:ADP-heptose:LPS heptosyltransferase
VFGEGVKPGSALDRLRPHSVVVLRALRGLGDMLCAVPALRALRAALPETRITLITLPAVMGLMERYPGLIDDFLAFPGFPGIPEVPFDPAAVPPFLAGVQAERYDLAIQLHGSGVRTNQFVELLGAARHAGLFLPGEYCPDPELWLDYPGRGHEIHRLLALMTFLGAPDAGDRLDFPLSEDDGAALAGLLTAEGLEPGRFAVLHPGAEDPRRRWPAPRFAAVADRLSEHGLEVVLTGMPNEAPINAAVRRAAQSGIRDLTGRTDVGMLGALFSAAALVVCNDTGASHLAAAVGAPSVVVFAASERSRWAPLDTAKHRAVVTSSAPPPFDADTHCLRDACLYAPGKSPRHRGTASVAKVLAQVEDLLDEARQGPRGPHSALS